MSVERKKIVKFCEDYLKVSNFDDKCHNGLQIEGVERINKIITGVSLSEQLIKQAIQKKAKMIIVHHGLFNKFIQTPIEITGITKDRLKLILENNINLCGFHLPLDAHPIIGNNISLCRLLGVLDPKPFSIGFVGELKEKMQFNNFVNVVNQLLGIKAAVIAGGPKQIKKIAIISGGASPYYPEAVKVSADTFLSGDIREELTWEIPEAKINYINAGHYNTEKLGIKNLGELISKKFNIKVEFVDIPNEI